MRAIGYCHPTNDQEGSLAEMERAFAEYCGRNNHQAVEFFGDAGASGSGQRDEYRRMIDHMRNSGSQFLVVVPGARDLGSDLEAVARAMVELEETGAKVACIDERVPDPLQNALHVLGVEGVSRVRSSRIKESMRERALKGKALGKPVYGYRIGESGTFEVVQEEAAVVELIYRLYTKDGLGLRLITQQLNERRIPTRRGGKWNVVTIRDVLKNPAYMGTYNRFGFRVPGVHEAIIPSEVFRKAQTQTRERRPVGRVMDSQPFELSGLVYCRYCGNKMMGATRRQAWKRKDGRRANAVYRYYQCQSRNNQSVCDYHTWRASLLENSVLSQLKHALRGVTSDPARSPVNDEHRQSVDAMRRARVKNAERKFVQAMKRAARGEVKVRVLGDYLGELDRMRRALDSPDRSVDAMAVLDKWDSLDFAQRQTFLEDHVVRIDVGDDSVEVIV